MESYFSIDFIQYWSAFQLAALGRDPYDPQLLLEQQQLIRAGLSQPTMMWNPPWILILLAPILTLPFQVSALAFASLNIVFSGWAAKCSALVEDRHQSLFYLIFLTATFYPVWSCISFGQISLLLLVGALLVLRGVFRGALVPFALGSIILSLKPHLFLIFGVVLLSRLARLRWYAPVFAAGVAIGIVVGVSELVFPGLIAAWVEALRHPGPGADAPPSFAVTTLVGVVRGLLRDSQGMEPLLPMGIVPLLPAVAFMVWQLRSKAVFPLQRLWPGVLAFSYLFSPYGWTFDICLLLPAWIVGQSSLLSRERNWTDFCIMGLGFGAQVVAFGIQYVPGLTLHQSSYWWLPVVMVVSWGYSEFTLPRKSCSDRVVL